MAEDYVDRPSERATALTVSADRSNAVSSASDIGTSRTERMPSAPTTVGQ